MEAYCVRARARMHKTFTVCGWISRGATRTPCRRICGLFKYQSVIYIESNIFANCDMAFYWLLTRQYLIAISLFLAPFCAPHLLHMCVLCFLSISLLQISSVKCVLSLRARLACIQLISKEPIMNNISHRKRKSMSEERKIFTKYAAVAAAT